MQFTPINSFQNARIKGVVKLREAKERKQTGCTIVEGLREIERALEAGVVFKEIFVCPSLLKKNKIPEALFQKASGDLAIYEVNKDLYEKISFGDREEGILAVIAITPVSVEKRIPKPDGLFVIVEGVEKPGNLGAILRTCDGAGVDGVFVCDAATDLYNPNVIRASLGTVFSCPIAVGTKEEVLAHLKKYQVWIVLTLPEGQTIYTQLDLRGTLAIVLGSEQKGLSDFWIKKADQSVKIPMQGRADSLNVSTTAAIVIFEALRQRGIFKSK